MRCDLKVAAERNSASDNKVVLANLQRVDGEWSTYNLEGPRDFEPARRCSEVTPRPFGEGAEMIFDMAFGQRLAPGG